MGGGAAAFTFPLRVRRPSLGLGLFKACLPRSPWNGATAPLHYQSTAPAASTTVLQQTCFCFRKAKVFPFTFAFAISSQHLWTSHVSTYLLLVKISAHEILAPLRSLGGDCVHVFHPVNVECVCLCLRGKKVRRISLSIHNTFPLCSGFKWELLVPTWVTETKTGINWSSSGSAHDFLTMPTVLSSISNIISSVTYVPEK